MLYFIFSDNNTLKLSDTLKSKLKDSVDMPISHDRSKDKSPTSSLKNSPKVSKKNHVSILEESLSTKESNHENELPQSRYYGYFILRLKESVNNSFKFSFFN